jgi:hypothetical protein
VTSFYFTAFLAVATTLAFYFYGRRRPVGQPITWGEAFLGGGALFAYMIIIYALLPNAWLQWVTGALRWRADKVGIPLGMLHHWRVDIGHTHIFTINWLRNGHKYLWFIPVDKGLAWPKGITFFGHGKLGVSAATMGDIGATVIYVIALGVHFKGWLWWQKRGQARPATLELPRSAYGRPLVKKV